MRPTGPGDTGDDTGSTVVVGPLAMLATVMVLVMLLHWILAGWAHGVARTALDEAARAGAASGAGVAECEHRIDQALDQLLGDIATVTRSCARDGDYMTATADVTVRSWLPGIRDRQFTIAASSIQEFEAD